MKFLLADFAAIKAEIARRSTLQRFVLLAYLGVIAYVFRETAAYSLSTLKVLALWYVAALGYLFYVREEMEIERLGGIIRSLIVPIAGAALNVPVHQLLPSETDPEANGTTARRVAYNRIFLWTILFIIPATVTAIFILRHMDRVTFILNLCKATPYFAVVIAIAIAAVVYLLIRHTLWRGEQNDT